MESSESFRVYMLASLPFLCSEARGGLDLCGALPQWPLGGTHAFRRAESLLAATGRIIANVWLSGRGDGMDQQ